LQTGLQDPDAEVRRSAVIALGNAEDESQVPLLLVALADVHPEVQKAALTALKNIRQRPVIAALVPMLRQSDAGVRGTAANVLEGLDKGCDNGFDKGAKNSQSALPIPSLGANSLSHEITTAWLDRGRSDLVVDLST
jgi:HEAT repeat protein